jgi:hypothetical protein
MGRKEPTLSARGPPPAEAFAHTVLCTKKALSRPSDSPIMGWPSPALPCIARESDASRDVPQSSILHGQRTNKGCPRPSTGTEPAEAALVLVLPQAQSPQRLSSSCHGHRARRGCPRPFTGTEPTEAVLVLVLPQAQSQPRLSSSCHGHRANQGCPRPFTGTEPPKAVLVLSLPRA